MHKSIKKLTVQIGRSGKNILAGCFLFCNCNFYIKSFVIVQNDINNCKILPYCANTSHTCNCLIYMYYLCKIYNSYIYIICNTYNYYITIA